ncbi:MAG: heavy metal sensor histidine kinase [Betaproteobacteria bacterium]|nr:heavy metal sensor histidine kinase [Betaproteobacteria bacterium]MBU6510973.1 heavy metal sensor histidine kinase [Betaproteobacteria bacterium]MDE1954595.1 heavy metal sensor histidine kinase [Betaproteobacteria bacterium]MDE2151316.1 heavy metal sensor histidine kinase [Betaproteobacteria bacterium]MDE2480002.1 heavy metal sensor histidine kinase [Betaproteobacteria bacterium]
MPMIEPLVARAGWRARRPASLALRVTAWVGLATTLIFLVAAWALEVSIEEHFAGQDLGQLRPVAQTLRLALDDAAAGGGSEALQQRFAETIADHHEVYFRVEGADGRVLYDATPAGLAARADADPAVAQLDAAALHVWTTGGRSYRGAVLRIDRSTVILATAIDYHLRFLAALRRALWLGTLGASAFSVLVAWLAVRQGHAPIRRIGARMREVSSERLDVRLDPDKVPVELAGLVASFNAMLERIGQSFERLSNFSADIAHELRTPVTNLRTQTQVALSRARSAEDYREILYSNLEEYERMSAMIGDMLFLAQAEHQLIRPEQAEVDMVAEVGELFEYFEAWAEERGVRLEAFGEAARLRGDRAMLRRALSNLLSNAIRHTAAGEAVSVRFESEPTGWLEVRVENPGPDIAAEHLPHLFDRFYRVDPSRQRNGQGAGLGLAIVKSIVEAHGGSAGAVSAKGRTRFWIRLPVAMPGPRHYSLLSR